MMLRATSIAFKAFRNAFAFLLRNSKFHGLLSCISRKRNPKRDNCGCTIILSFTKSAIVIRPMRGLNLFVLISRFKFQFGERWEP